MNKANGGDGIPVELFQIVKWSLDISNFLEEIFLLSHSIVFLYFFALITEEGFLIFPCYSLELCIQMGAALNMTANLENSAVATELEKVSFHSNPQKGNAKECSNYHTIALILHASKVMLKILQARLQQFMNHKLPNVQAGFRKGRGTRDQMTNICWIIEKAREFQKNIHFCFIDYAKAFDCLHHNKLRKIL